MAVPRKPPFKRPSIHTSTPHCMLMKWKHDTKHIRNLLPLCWKFHFSVKKKTNKPKKKHDCYTYINKKDNKNSFHLFTSSPLDYYFRNFFFLFCFCWFYFFIFSRQCSIHQSLCWRLCGWLSIFCCALVHGSRAAQ